LVAKTKDWFLTRVESASESRESRSVRELSTCVEDAEGEREADVAGEEEPELVVAAAAYHQEQIRGRWRMRSRTPWGKAAAAAAGRGGASGAAAAGGSK
jgi:hypothetical protein